MTVVDKYLVLLWWFPPVEWILERMPWTKGLGNGGFVYVSVCCNWQRLESVTRWVAISLVSLVSFLLRHSTIMLAAVAHVTAWLGLKDILWLKLLAEIVSLLPSLKVCLPLSFCCCCF